MSRSMVTSGPMLGAPAVFGDFLSRDRLLPGGAKITAADFHNHGAFQVVVGAAGAAIGATTVPVDALEGALPSGTVLNFANLANVVVTVGAAGALATATTVPVDALSGPIPAGATIHLGTNKYLTLSAPAAAGATSLTTLAIPTALVDDDTGTYVGSDRLVRLTAAAAEGATSLTVEPLDGALVDNDAAWYEGTGKRMIPAGTVVTRSDADAAYGAPNDAHAHVGIVAFDVPDADHVNDVEIARPGIGTVVHRNYLPTNSAWAGLSSTIKALLIANYNITVAHE